MNNLKDKEIAGNLAIDAVEGSSESASMNEGRTSQASLSSLIWSVADLLRGSFRQSDYGKIVLPFTVLRRLDCVLEPTKEKALAVFREKSEANQNFEPFVLRATGQAFYNISSMDFKALLGDPDNIVANLTAYINGFSENVRDIFEQFEFHSQIERLSKANVLFEVSQKFAQAEMHPDAVTNEQMGTIFEELIRKFAEMSNETAGEHFTPREVIRLMVNLIFMEDNEVLTKPGVVRTIYDPTAGTGGMLSVAGDYLAELNPEARLTMFGQELNPESYAICKADMLIKGQDVKNIRFGNTLSDDKHVGEVYDYCLSNPPFGVDWKGVQRIVTKEHTEEGLAGRFGPGLPRVSDGSLLFLMHLVSKMRSAEKGGSRVAIVLNGSPLFTGGAGSGESEIRKYLLENDLVEAIIGLPTDMFYNTGISTYIWVLTNKKVDDRQGQVQLIDGSDMYQKTRKSLGSKRKELSEANINDITKLMGDFIEAEMVTVFDAEGKQVSSQIVRSTDSAVALVPGQIAQKKPVSRIFDNTEFGYHAITVERPLLDEAGNPVISTKGKNKGKKVVDTSKRDTEVIPLSEDIDGYFQREVIPHAPDAWIDEEKTKVGYEIAFNRQFYVFEPSRPLEAIDADLKKTTDEILSMIAGLTV